MIRANLLPQASAKIALFGLTLNARLLRQICVATACVGLATAATAALELRRLGDLEESAARQRALVSANDARRAEVRAVALELAHLQDVRASANELRDSGNEVALEIARIGNAIPVGVWLDRLSWSAQAFELAGETSSLESAGSTAALLERDVSGGKALLTDVRRRDDGHYAFVTEFDVQK
jgi:Tfp pilus assembly protein PilN